ncbi:MAG: aldo/keto reductase [Clostridiaceae bacterium]|nr:aldo/keto reductase [Clostridiaceae bacterium]
MHTLKIGNTDISNIILGSSYFGSAIDTEKSFALMDIYYARGGRAIDTARVYGAWSDAGIGASEAVIGRWLASRKPAGVRVITKGAHPAPGHMEVSRLDRASILDDAARSVDALGVTPALWFLHRDDRERPVEEIAETLAALVDAGYADAVGASNWRVDRIAVYNAYAGAHGLPCFAASQIQWSLAATTPEAYGDPTLVCMTDTEYAWYREYRFPVLAFSSQAKGFFSKAIAHGLDSLPEKARARFATPENLMRLEWVRAEATSTGRSPASIVLSYITENEVPAAAVIGCSSVEQLLDSLS